MTPSKAHDLSQVQTLILAGGQGERLFPLTKFRAKAAVPFGGTFRIIDFTLSNCWNSGLTDVALLTQHLHEDLHSYVHRGWREFWVGSEDEKNSIVCLPPASGKRYRGTADAVFQNIPIMSHKGSQHVLILSGDHVYSMDYRNLLRTHIEADADVTISTVEHPAESAREFGIVETDEDLRVTGYWEKPSNPRCLPQRSDTSLVNMGVYVFKMQALIDVLHRTCAEGIGYDFGHHVIPALIGTARMVAYNFRDEASNAPCYWRDIGTIDSYYAANMDLTRPDPPFSPHSDKHHSRLVSHPRQAANSESLTTSWAAMASAGVRVSDTVISEGVLFEGDAEVECSVLLPGSRIGKGVRLRRVIVGEGVQIPAGFDAGLDLENDKKRFTITARGIVVISETPRCTLPMPARPDRETTLAHRSTRKITIPKSL